MKPSPRTILGTLTLAAGAVALGLFAPQWRATRALRLGTEALGEGRPGDALGPLEAAARAADPSHRFRALHNLALAHLALALDAPPVRARPHVDAAIEAGRAALRLDGDATATRWNLVLAERMRGGDRPAAPTARPPRRASLAGAGSTGAPVPSVRAPRPGTGGPAFAPEVAAAVLDGLEGAQLDAALRAAGAGSFAAARGGPPW